MLWLLSCVDELELQQADETVAVVVQAYFYDVKEDATFAQLPFCAGGTHSPGRHCHSTVTVCH